MFDLEHVESLSDIVGKLSAQELPKGFQLVKMHVPELEDDVVTIRIEAFDTEKGIPIITRNLTVYSDLGFRLWVAGSELPTLKTVKLTSVPGKLGTTTEILNILAFLKAQPLEEGSVTLAIHFLCKVSTDDTVGCDKFGEFAAEQLQLRVSPASKRRYSTKLMSTALVWSRTSPRLYEDMRSSGLLILPHRVTLRRLTSALSVQDGLEIGTMKYLEMRLAKLSPRERLVNLAMDEVYCAKSLELAGGRLYGESSNGTGSATNTLFCTHISSVAGNYEDLVTMSPVTRITTEEMKNILFKVLRCLTQLGFRVVSVTTDGHRANQSFHRALSEDGSHPEYILNPWGLHSDDRIYTMYDSVHLFKNMYFNLLNKRTLHCPALDEAGTPLDVNISHLEKIHAMEYSSQAKMAYRLTDKVLHPTSIERVNVQLAIAATHETTIAALRFYGQQEQYSAFNQTAEFLHYVRTWFDIVNVKSPWKRVRRNNGMLQPISNTNQESLAYIEKFGNMMLNWEKQTKKTTQISTDTIRGVAATCRGLAGLAKYLLGHWPGVRSPWKSAVRQDRRPLWTSPKTGGWQLLGQLSTVFSREKLSSVPKAFCGCRATVSTP